MFSRTRSKQTFTPATPLAFATSHFILHSLYAPLTVSLPSKEEEMFVILSFLHFFSSTKGKNNKNASVLLCLKERQRREFPFSPYKTFYCSPRKLPLDMFLTDVMCSAIACKRASSSSWVMVVPLYPISGRALVSRDTRI